MTRVVLDVSTTWAWRRPPVGIVRTEHKFASFLLHQRDVEVAFCRFDAVRKQHVAVSRDAIGALLAPPEAPPTSESSHGATLAGAPAGATRPRRHLRHSAVRFAKGAGWAIVHRMPEPMRPDAHRTMRLGLDFLRGVRDLGRRYRALRQTRRAMLQDARGTGQHGDQGDATRFAFRPDDVYCSLGLDWEYNDLAVVHGERRRVGFRTLMFCYDTIPVLFPHLMSFDARHFFARHFVDLAHAADHVVSISETSRNDLLALLRETGAPTPPVDVLHLGTDFAVADGTGTPPAGFDAARPFVLYVSTIEARKNHELLYHIWDRLAAKHGTDAVPDLVLVGMVGWGVGDLTFRMRTNPRVRSRVRILDHLADAELAWLYRNCLFTTFPSLYEGWGLPVVESLSLGKPCITSTAPAVVEAGQGMTRALDPHDVPAWEAAIEALWLDNALRESEGLRLRERYRAQTWERHGAALLNLALELANARRD